MLNTLKCVSYTKEKLNEKTHTKLVRLYDNEIAIMKENARNKFGGKLI